MIVKIRTKEHNGNGDYIFGEDIVYIWILGESSFQFIDENEIPKNAVFKSIYENQFIEVYYLIDY